MCRYESTFQNGGVVFKASLESASCPEISQLASSHCQGAAFCYTGTGAEPSLCQHCGQLLVAH